VVVAQAFLRLGLVLGLTADQVVVVLMVRLEALQQETAQETLEEQAATIRAVEVAVNQRLAGTVTTLDLPQDQAGLA
jgi:hypothetical protein